MWFGFTRNFEAGWIPAFYDGNVRGAKGFVKRNEEGRTTSTSD
jgi:hypothetical protein